jgi:hypothetical protein
VPSIDTVACAYLKDGSGLRIVFATPASILQDSWSFVDVPGLGQAPYLGVSGVVLSQGTNSLYATVQLSYDDLGAFLSSDGFEILRFPLTTFTGAGPSTPSRWTYRDWGPRPQPVPECETTYYAGFLSSNDALVVFHADESSGRMDTAVVPVGAFGHAVDGNRDPAGRGFLNDIYSSRTEGATLAGEDLWFAWTAGEGGRLSMPRPYVEVARVRASDFSLLDQQTVESPAFDVGYPSLASNADGEVAVAFHAGGGALYSSLGVGLLTGTRTVELAIEGDRSLTAGQTAISGDPAGGTGFVATGAVRTEGPGGNGPKVRLASFGRGSLPVPRWSIRGEVRGPGFQSVPGAVVTAGFGAATVGPTRGFEISDIQPGPRRVVPFAEGYGFLPPYRTVTPGPGQPSARFEGAEHLLGLWTNAGKVSVDRSGDHLFRIRGYVGFLDPANVEEFDPHGRLFDVAVAAGSAIYERNLGYYGSSWRRRGRRFIWRLGREELILRPAPDREVGLYRFSLRARAQAKGPIGNPVGISLRWGKGLGSETLDWDSPSDQVLRR